ncbi:MAG: methyl-accepting chemotaxis protein [Planctomycetota bacterium]|nr:MAG: methyl-accepting chemotaxis protein [Planctomycetota bacterium]
MKLQKKIVITSIGGVVVTAVAIIVLLVSQKSWLKESVRREVGILGRDQCAKVTSSVYQMLEVYNEAMKKRMHNDLELAFECLEDVGEVTFDSETVTWEAINQYTKQPTRVELPKMLVGGQWLGMNRSADQPSLVVDELQKRSGDTCTIFQRMNEQGDLLRVCTNVIKSDGTRAIGTYIPAVNPDGKANPVVSTVMRGETYIGRAYVVNKWYLTAYAPIFDADKKVVGCLYVGVPQEDVPELREGIMNVVVGKTGYVYVLQGSGENKGCYVISKGGERDGENILEAKDANGTPFIQELIDKALKAKPGEISFQRYAWQNPGEDHARWKVAAVTYYEPWDWVIGAGAYEDDFEDALGRIDASLSTTIWWTIAGAVVAVVLCSIVAVWMSKKTVGVLNTTVAMLADIAQGEGDLTKRLEVDSKDEVGELAHWFNIFIDKLHDMIQQIVESAAQFTEGARVVAESSQTVAQGAQTQSATVEEMTAAIEELTNSVEAVRALATEADQLARRSSQYAENGSHAVEKSIEAMNAIRDSSKRIADIIQVISEIASQTNLLALNAAIEAARAGEHGMGFAVVADEVRKLAERSNQAAQEIAQLIQESTQLVEEGANLSDGMGEALTQILESVQSTAEKIGTIAETTTRQTETAKEVSQSIQGVAQVAEQSAAGSEEMASSSEELGAQADALRELVSGFRTRGS